MPILPPVYFFSMAHSVSRRCGDRRRTGNFAAAAPARAREVVEDWLIKRARFAAIAPAFLRLQGS
jgi:hypothetical protein